MRRLALVLLLSSACATAQPDRVGARNVGQNETAGCCCLIYAGPPESCRPNFTESACDQDGNFQGKVVRWTAGACPG